MTSKMTLPPLLHSYASGLFTVSGQAFMLLMFVYKGYIKIDQRKETFS